MRGYYEWTGEKGDKTLHFPHGAGLLAVGGRTRSMEVKGEKARCFVVITREARDAGGEVHDRMPAFLDRYAVDAWLDPERLDAGGRTSMLALLDASSASMAAGIRQCVVDRRVNSVRAGDPSDASLILPVG